jgi:hypothetical protein
VTSSTSTSASGKVEEASSSASPLAPCRTIAERSPSEPDFARGAAFFPPLQLDRDSSLAIAAA